MAVPGSGANKTLGKIRKELHATSTSDDYDNGPKTSPATYLKKASDGTHATINVNSTSTPNASAPYGMNEFSGYNHLQQAPGGGKILCTTIYETTGFKDWKVAGILWNKHLNKHLTKYHQIGYHKIFFQFTKLMKKNKYIFNLGKYMVTQRTRDIKAIMNNKKRHVPGMIVRYIFEPLSFCVGYISEKLKKRGK